MTDLSRFVFGERIVGYYTSLAKSFSSIPVAVFVSEIIQFTPKDGQGWVARTETEWENIGFSANDIRKIRDKLKSAGILEEDRKGELRYRIQPQVLADYINGKEPKIVKIDKPAKKESEKKETLNKLVVEFHKAGLPTPNFIGFQARSARDLLIRFSEYEIARCWRDIEDGKYGNEFVKQWLSFNFMAKHDLVSRWKRWVEDGKPKSSGFFDLKNKSNDNNRIASQEVIDALDR